LLKQAVVLVLWNDYLHANILTKEGKNIF